MPGYVVTVKGGVRTVVVAGENVTVTGVGTPADPYVVSATLGASGESMALELMDPAIESIPPVAVQNPDGSVTLQGAFDVPGPLNPGEVTIVMMLPDGYLPSSVGTYSVAADVADDNHHVPVAARVVLDVDGTVAVVSPMVNDGVWLSVFLYSLTYWPAVE